MFFWICIFGEQNQTCLVVLVHQLSSLLECLYRLSVKPLICNPSQTPSSLTFHLQLPLVSPWASWTTQHWLKPMILWCQSLLNCLLYACIEMLNPGPRDVMDFTPFSFDRFIICTCFLACFCIWHAWESFTVPCNVCEVLLNMVLFFSKQSMS